MVLVRLGRVVLAFDSFKELLLSDNIGSPTAVTNAPHICEEGIRLSEKDHTQINISGVHAGHTNPSGVSFFQE